MNEHGRTHCQTGRSPYPLLGQLLVYGGICVPQEVSVAAKISRGMAAPIGQFLVESGALTSDLLHCVLEYQEDVRTGNMDLEDAVVRIKIAAAAADSDICALRAS